MNFFSTWCHVVFMFYYVTCSHDLLLNCIYIYAMIKRILMLMKKFKSISEIL